MPSPFKLEAAHKAPDRAARIRKMADIMREREAAEGACQSNHLRAAGFTEAEIRAYADDARAILSGRKLPIRVPAPPGRKEGAALVAEARRIRRRNHAAQEVGHG